MVPTYRSGPQLDDAVASLDVQSLPPGELEVLLIDDGSPDATFHDDRDGPGESRLEILASTDIYVRAARMGGPLHGGVWDLGAHDAFLWGRNHRRVQTPKGWTASAVVHGRPVRAYATSQGTVASTWATRRAGSPRDWRSSSRARTGADVAGVRGTSSEDSP
ncbi:glycosyltransferase [Agromyces italicus]|uniref:glycosyltransferase n=1 Tax=Agromyces italicus TaxID=279572 RepID=UPI001FDF1C53|nr:glycosyltransferase [Agromyces italicus]